MKNNFMNIPLKYYFTVLHNVLFLTWYWFWECFVFQCTGISIIVMILTGILKPTIQHFSVQSQIIWFIKTILLCFKKGSSLLKDVVLWWQNKFPSFAQLFSFLQINHVQFTITFANFFSPKMLSCLMDKTLQTFDHSPNSLHINCRRMILIIFSITPSKQLNSKSPFQYPVSIRTWNLTMTINVKGAKYFSILDLIFLPYLRKTCRSHSTCCHVCPHQQEHQSSGLLPCNNDSW